MPLWIADVALVISTLAATITIIVGLFQLHELRTNRLKKGK